MVFLLPTSCCCSVAQEFQAKWQALEPFFQNTLTLSPATVAALAANNHRDFCEHVAQAYLLTMASGGQGGVYKYYFYGQTAGAARSTVLVEMVVEAASGQTSCVLKADTASALKPQFVELWTCCLAGWER